jgi:lipocalin
MDQELNLKLDQYYEKFGDVFPMTEYNLSKKEAIKFIDKCLEKNKKAQEIEPLDENVMY